MTRAALDRRAVVCQLVKYGRAWRLVRLESGIRALILRAYGPATPSLPHRYLTSGLGRT